MAGGGKVRIIDEPNDPAAARVVNGRLLVSSTGGGGGGGDVNIASIGGNVVTTTLPVSGNVGILGTVPVSGTVAISGTVPVSGTVTIQEPLDVEVQNTVDVTGSSVIILSTQSLTPGTASMNLGKATDQASALGDVGVASLAIRSDTGAYLVSADEDYAPLIVNGLGRLWVAWDNQTIDSVGSVNAIVPGVGATNLGKAEDAVHSSGDVGVQVLAVRRDTLASSTSANGDYATFSVDSVGALWTRLAGMTTIALSGSTRGRPIQITGTTSGAAVTLHTATTTAGQIDKLYVDLTNTGTAAVVVTIEFGTTGAGNEIDVTVPANATVRAVDGSVIGGAATDTVRAYASVANVINVTGRVERLS